jgi:uncharacterized membrane protein YqaE (UPF0057 family)
MPATANSLTADDWTLFDKIMYGGLGYGSFCLPTDFFKVIVAILFPPLGEIINVLEDTITSNFPYFTMDTLKLLCTYNSINKIVYSFLLTTFFYIPGLVYTLTNIVQKERIVSNNIYIAVEYVLTNPARIVSEGGKFIGDYPLQGRNYKYYISNNNKIGYVYDENNRLILILLPNGVKYRVNKVGNLSSSTNDDNTDYFNKLGNEISNAFKTAFKDNVGSAFETAGSAIASIFT